jgi:two-component system cell cycle response regulator DivK
MSKSEILYIEDNFHNRRIVRKILEREGYSLFECEDGLEGYEMLKAMKPGIVLLDISLPTMDGMEIAGKVKEDPELQHIYLIALTASAMQGDRERFLAGGCDDYLSKPFRALDLVEMVNKYEKLVNLGSPALDPQQAGLHVVDQEKPAEDQADRDVVTVEVTLPSAEAEVVDEAPAEEVPAAEVETEPETVEEPEADEDVPESAVVVEAPEEDAPVAEAEVEPDTVEEAAAAEPAPEPAEAKQEQEPEPEPAEALSGYNAGSGDTAELKLDPSSQDETAWALVTETVELQQAGEISPEAEPGEEPLEAAADQEAASEEDSAKDRVENLVEAFRGKNSAEALRAEIMGLINPDNLKPADPNSQQA